MLRIYTTRADTLFGATYMVIAPEHPFVERLTAPEQSETVRAYCEQAARKSDLDRTDLAKEKTGVWTGSYAVNPVNGESIPIWVADYVLISYGTGAIMAVPAHDTRDFEFAKQFDLPIIAVVDPSISPLPLGEGPGVRASTENSPHPNPLPEGEGTQVVAFIADGVAINSGPYNGLTTAEFKQKIAEDLTTQGIGRAAVNYKLRDWLFSRQHFWGEPFPLLHELDDDGRPTGRIRALEPSELPLDLPAEMAFDADHDRPEPPLDKAPNDWLYVTIDGRRYKRETNTMPQWAGSCWYYLRFLDPKNDRALVDPQVEKAWMPVDLYVGGAEHAVLHLLYARFWHKVLFDRGHVGGAEPFQKLVNQGMILGEPQYERHFRLRVTDEEERGEAVSYEEVENEHTIMEDVKKEDVEIRNGKPYLKGTKYMLSCRAEKMSKSRGNVVNPDEVVREYGADSLRLFEMFMGPLEAVKPWNMDGVSGVRGFLDRVWRMIVDERAETMQLNPAVQVVEPSAEQNRVLHRTIKAVTADLDQMSFNTAISRMMEFTNFFLKQEPRPRAAMEKLVLLLSPFAPHAAEELWAALGHDESLTFEPWPEFNEAAIKEDTIEVPVQIGGKLRGRIQVPADADKAALESAARAEPKIAELLAGKTVVKSIVVPGRMVNFVVK